MKWHASEYYRKNKPRGNVSPLDDMLPNFILWGALFLICGFGFVRAKTHQYLVADLKAMFGTIIVSIAVVTSIRRLMASGYDLVGCLFEFLNRYFILNDVLIVIQYFVPYFFMNRSAIASVNNRAYFDQLTGLLGINGTTRWDIWSIAIIILNFYITSIMNFLECQNCIFMVLYFLFGAIVQSPCLSLHQFSDVDLVVQNAVHCFGRPRRLIALAEMQAQLCTALQLSCSRGRHLFRIQSVCDPLIIHATDLPEENILHCFRCQFVHDQLGMIAGVLLISIGCKTSHKITAFPLDRKLALDFDGNVPAVRIVEQVPHWDHDGIAGLPRRLTVIVVRHCNQPNPHDRKNAFQITSHFNVIPSKAGQIFHQNAVDSPLFQFPEQVLERRPFK